MKPTNTKKDQKVSKFKKNKPTLKVKAKKKRVKLLIGKVVGTTKNQVRYKQGKKWKIKYTKNRALTIKKLKSKKKVKIQVRAVMVYGKKKVYGLWAVSYTHLFAATVFFININFGNIIIPPY